MATQGASKTSCRAVYEKFKDGTVKDISDELPFEIPTTWRWVRLGTIARKLTDGTHQTPKYCQSGVPFLSVKDISNGNVSFANCKFISEAEHKLLYSRCDPQNGDILLSKVGTTGIPVLVDTDVQFSLFVSVALLRIFKECVYNKYILNAMLSPFSQMQVEDNTRGVGNKNWVMRDIAHTLIPLPPLAEQKRIVAKIEKLMPLVEEYGKMEETRLQLDADLPAMLEKSILQDAIQGKLVPQDPNDEPASELLKRIANERKALVKAGKLKRDKGESVIFRGSDRLAYETRNGETVCIQDEIPFEIPDSWEWVRLGNITTFLHRGKSPTYVPHSDCPMFAQKCNQWDGIHLEKCKFCDEAKYKTFQDEYHLRDYDVVVNSTGTGTLGRVGIFHDSELAKHGYLSIVPDSNVTVVRTSLHDLSQYIYHYLCTKFCWEWMNNNADGSTKQKELYTSTLASLLIPIPPLAEQRRIASAIPLLLNNCNQLKQQPTM